VSAEVFNEVGIDSGFIEQHEDGSLKEKISTFRNQRKIDFIEIRICEFVLRPQFFALVLA